MNMFKAKAKNAIYFCCMCVISEGRWAREQNLGPARPSFKLNNKQIADRHSLEGRLWSTFYFSRFSIRFCSFVSLFCQMNGTLITIYLSSASTLPSLSSGFGSRRRRGRRSTTSRLGWSGRSTTGRLGRSRRSGGSLCCTSFRSIYNDGSICGNRGAITRWGWDCDSGNDRVWLRVLPYYWKASRQLKVIKFEVESTIEEAEDGVAALGNLGLLCCFVLEVLGCLLSLTHDGSHGLGKGHLVGPRCQLLDVSKSEGGFSIYADGGLSHDLRGVSGAQVDVFVGAAVIG